MKNNYNFPTLGRLLALVCLLALRAAPAGAQVASYAFAQGTAPYVPITGGTLVAVSTAGLGPGPPTLYGTVYILPANAIPFPFQFNGIAYTDACITSSGYLTLGGTVPHTHYDSMPAAIGYYNVFTPLSEPVGTEYEAALSPLGGRIWGNSIANVGGLGEIRYQTLGTRPNRVFVVQWKNMRQWNNGGGVLNFQLRLSETSQAVQFAYGGCQSDQVLPVQVGLRGSSLNDFQARTGTWAASTASTTSTAGLEVSPGSSPAVGLTYTFTPPAPLPCGQPFSLVATPAGTQAGLNWRVLAPNPGPYTLVYGPAGFNPATGGLGGGPRTVTGTSATITGLTPSTDYEFYVTQQCGGAAGASPASSPPGRFRTTVLNDEPVDAVPLPTAATCQPVASSTAGATRTVGNGYDPFLACGTSLTDSDRDVWFTVTTAASGPASTGMQIAVTGATANKLRVFRSPNGAAGPFTEIYCVGDNGNGRTIPPFVLAPLQPSTTYYLMVSNSGVNARSGPITLCSIVPPTCSDPTAVAADISTATSFTATTARVLFQPGNGATDYTVTLTPPGGPTQIYPGRLTTSPALLTGLTPATTYAATLQANCATGGVGAAVPFVLYTRPINNAPADAPALPITAGCQPTPGSTVNATNSVVGTGSGCGAVRPRDVWYTFTTSATGPASRGVRIVVAGVGAQQVRVFSTPGPNGPFTELGCAAGSSNTAAPFLDLATLTPATTYYVLVGSYGIPVVMGPFTICITEPPTCGVPTQLAVTAIGNTTANLTFAGSVPAATAGYTVALTPQGSTTPTRTLAGAGSPLALTGLQPGTYYTALLRANCGPGGLSEPATVRFRTTGPPANDLCANALLVQCGDGPVPGIITGATATGEPTAACAGPGPLGPGVWYRLAGTGQDATITLCAPFTGNPDLQLLAYTGTCGNWQCVGSNDDGTACPLGDMPNLTIATVAGQDYYLLVADAGRVLPAQHDGQFELTVTCAAPPACPAPTGLVISQVAGTAATATWTATPGATAYEVVWQPLSGATAPLVAPVPAGQLSTRATTLRPNTLYRATVSAVCASNRQRSVGASVDFSTILSARNPALAAQVELFPNPAHATATLAVPAALRADGTATATLYNALGQAVRRLALPAGAVPVTVDVAGLPPGRYLLRLDTALGSLGKPLVVE